MRNRLLGLQRATTPGMGGAFYVMVRAIDMPDLQLKFPAHRLSRIRNPAQILYAGSFTPDFLDLVTAYPIILKYAY